MQDTLNPIEQSLLHEIVSLYTSDLETEIHSYRHLQCPACSKQAVVNIVTRHLQLLQFRQHLHADVLAACMML